MGMLLIILMLKYRVNDPNPIIMCICLLQLSLFGSFLDHLFISLDLNLEYPIFFPDSIQLLVVLFIVSLDFLHAPLHYVALTLYLRLYDLLVYQVDTLAFWVESLVCPACSTFGQRLSHTRGGLRDIQGRVCAQRFIQKVS